MLKHEELDIKKNIAANRDVLTHDEWDFLYRSLKLSDREIEIVKCVFDDMTEHMIARFLNLSPATIHTYTCRLYRKLEIRSRAALVIKCFATLRHLNG